MAFLPVIVLLAGCADPLAAPLDLFHDLEGGEIAAQRPPPPGAGMPYPHLGTVPGRPALDSQAYRNGLQAQLLAERDRTQRAAADAPIPAIPPPPSPPPLPAPAAVPGSLAPAAAPSAVLDTADNPPAPPPPGPPAGEKLIILGAASDSSDAPTMPASPPSPATFEGVAVEPAPTPSVLPAALAPLPAGTQVFFPAGSAVLPPGQLQAVKQVASRRGRHAITVTGLGDAQSDTPDGQADAVALALRRALAIGQALRTLHVPAGQISLSARAFGQGAILQSS